MATPKLTTRRRLPTDPHDLFEAVGAQQDADRAADMILAEYIVPRQLREKIVRDWLIREISEYRAEKAREPFEHERTDRSPVGG